MNFNKQQIIFMALILCIDTSGEKASVALVENGICLDYKISAVQKEHASFLQPAIQEIFSKKLIELSAIDAVAVSIGPGSYTGLRVGLSSAKGLCYALQKPLIAIKTLTLMAYASQQTIKSIAQSESYFIVPMIDARRNEVFTAAFDAQLNSIELDKSLILSENSFLELLSVSPVFFTGNGAEKWQSQCHHDNAHFKSVSWHAGDMANMSEEAFNEKVFVPVDRATPFYLKEFYNTQTQAG